MAARYACTLGCVAFFVVIARGMIDGQGLSATLPACGAMALFAGIGAVAGKISEAAVDESVEHNIRAEIAAREQAAAPREETPAPRLFRRE